MFLYFYNKSWACRYSAVLKKSASDQKISIDALVFKKHISDALFLKQGYTII